MSQCDKTRPCLVDQEGLRGLELRWHLFQPASFSSQGPQALVEKPDGTMATVNAMLVRFTDVAQKSPIQVTVNDKTYDAKDFGVTVGGRVKIDTGKQDSSAWWVTHGILATGARDRSGDLLDPAGCTNAKLHRQIEDMQCLGDIKLDSPKTLAEKWLRVEDSSVPKGTVRYVNVDYPGVAIDDASYIRDIPIHSRLLREKIDNAYAKITISDGPSPFAEVSLGGSVMMRAFDPSGPAKTGLVTGSGVDKPHGVLMYADGSTYPANAATHPEQAVRDSVAQLEAKRLDELIATAPKNAKQVTDSIFSPEPTLPPQKYCEACGGWDGHKIGCKEGAK